MQQLGISARRADAQNASQVKLLSSLLEVASLLRWMHECQSIAITAVPPDSAALLKHAENLGLVSRRNGHTLILQEQRVQRLLRRLIRHVPIDLQDRCQQSFSWIALGSSASAMVEIDKGGDNANADESNVEGRHGLDLAQG